MAGTPTGDRPPRILPDLMSVNAAGGYPLTSAQLLSVGVVVLVVGDMLQPGHFGAFADGFEHGEAFHGVVGGGTVPVLFARRV
jgi:hypothetical protein